LDTLNKNVKEINKPERMCICCRRKGQKNEFFRITEQDGKYIFDKEMKVQARGFYVCKTNECIERLSKHKKYNIEIEQLVKMLEQVKNEKKSIIDILRPMKNSEYFVFGIDEVFDGIKRDKIKLVIIPSDIKAKYIEEFEGKYFIGLENGELVITDGKFNILKQEKVLKERIVKICVIENEIYVMGCENRIVKYRII